MNYPIYAIKFNFFIYLLIFISPSFHLSLQITSNHNYNDNNAVEIKKGMLAPTLVQMERQIDREIAADNKANGVCDNKNDNGNNIASSGQDDLFDSDSEDECENEDPMLMYGPQQQIVTNDLKSLDEMVNIIILLEMNVYKY